MPSIKKSLNLNYEQLLRWKENPTVNPKTGKTIKLNGPSYKVIQKLYDKFTDKYTEEECKKWIVNKSINPKTGRHITEGNLRYERIRNECEPYISQPSIALLEAAEQDFVEDIEEDIKNSPSISITQKLFQSCRNCAINVTNRIITSFGCVDKKCMAKGCPWKGRYGINMARIPKIVKAFALSLILRFIYVKRCCCLCLGHLLMFTCFILNTIAESKLSLDTRESIKIQKLIDKIETSTNLSDTSSKFIAAEADKLLNQYFTKVLVNPTREFNKIVAYIYNADSTDQGSFLTNFNNLNNEILQQQ